MSYAMVLIIEFYIFFIFDLVIFIELFLMRNIFFDIFYIGYLSESFINSRIGSV